MRPVIAALATVGLYSCADLDRPEPIPFVHEAASRNEEAYRRLERDFPAPLRLADLRWWERGDGLVVEYGLADGTRIRASGFERLTPLQRTVYRGVLDRYEGELRQGANISLTINPSEACRYPQIADYLQKEFTFKVPDDAAFRIADEPVPLAR